MFAHPNENSPMSLTLPRFRSSHSSFLKSQRQFIKHSLRSRGLKHQAKKGFKSKSLTKMCFQFFFAAAAATTGNNNFMSSADGFG